jgi:hypothetical protein
MRGRDGPEAEAAHGRDDVGVALNSKVLDQERPADERPDAEERDRDRADEQRHGERRPELGRREGQPERRRPDHELLSAPEPEVPEPIGRVVDLPRVHACTMAAGRSEGIGVVPDRRPWSHRCGATSPAG